MSAAAEDRWKGQYEMKVREISRVLDEIAPPGLAADWDNVGLLVGASQNEVRKILLCIDLTASVLAEAKRIRAQMIMAYHPVIFKPLRSVTHETCPIVYEAIRAGIAIYSSHTAMDAAEGGTNDCLADVLDLRDRKPLQPNSAGRQCKIVAYLQPGDLSDVAQAAFEAGAGKIGNYSQCSFFSHGIGTFCSGENANPTRGQPGSSEAVEEIKLEMVVPCAKAIDVVKAIRQAHSYEEPVVDVYPLENRGSLLGLGRVGRLVRPVRLTTLINRIKKALGVSKILHADGSGSAARKDMLIGIVAVAAGSCGDLWRSAIEARAGLYVTGEMRHHDALAASTAGMTVICVGHSYSERIVLGKLGEQLTAKMPKLKVALSRADRDPFEIV